MQWSITIGRIAGTALRVHITFLLFLVWIAIADYRTGGLLSAESSLVFTLLVFACVVAHEFGHISMARRFGIKTPDVTLWPMGGVANMERIPEDPWQELPVAVAGPLVNVVIATLLILVGRLSLPDLVTVDLGNAPLLVQLALVNISLVVFNLIPAFPMDGGRVLRALLAMRMAPQRATEIATRLGQVFAFLFVALGLFYNPMLILIGLFIYVAGSAELRSGQAHRILGGLVVADCVEQNIQNLPSDMPLRDAVDKLLRSSQHSFPIVDEMGKPIGILHRADLPEIVQQSDGAALVSSVMRPPGIVVSSTKLEDAVKDMTQMRNAPEIVVDGQGRVIGLLTLQGVAEVLMIRSLQPNWPLRQRKL